MIEQVASSAAVLLLSAATAYLAWQEGEAIYAAGAGPATGWRWRLGLFLLVVAIGFLGLAVLPAPPLIKVVGIVTLSFALGWLRYRQIRGWQELSDEFAPMREHNRKYPEQQWIATGCLVAICLLLGGALILIPFLTGSEFWTWPPWEPR